MKIQSITPTENLNSKNRSFKAQFVPNKIFRNLWQDATKNRCISRWDDIVECTKFFNMHNEDHFLEILEVSPNNRVKVLNRYNDAVREYDCSDTEGSSVLGELLKYLLYYYEEIYTRQPVESKNKITAVKEYMPIFVSDKKGLYKKLLEPVKKDERFLNIFKHFVDRFKGHSFEILDKKSFRFNGTNYNDYTVFDYRSGQTGKLRLTNDQNLVNLIKKIRKNDDMTSTATVKGRLYDDLTGQYLY